MAFSVNAKLAPPIIRSMFRLCKHPQTATLAPILNIAKPTFRARPLLVNRLGSHSLHTTPVRHDDNVTTTKATDSQQTISAEWVDAYGDGPPEEKVSALIDSAIIPWSELGTFQAILSPVFQPLMYYLDFLHSTCGLPWWLSIATTTLTARLMLFPIYAGMKKTSIRAHNLLPQTTRLQMKANEARAMGNEFEQQINMMKYRDLCRENQITLWNQAKGPLLQGPVFISMFLLLKQLCSHPVESMKTGGLMWFTDLTVYDPYFILPAVTSLTMLAIIELGLESGTAAPNSKIIWFIRCIPVGVFALTCKFPAGILLYWTTTNFVTFMFAGLLKVPKIKEALKFPAMVQHKDLPQQQGAFRDQMRHALRQSKAARTSVEARRLDEIAFRKAGIGPVQKTYKLPPNDNSKST